MKTYWNASVAVDGVTKCSGGDDTLAATLSRAITDCVYYQAIYPAAKVTIDGICESCAVCHNTGHVRQQRARSVRVLKCPECRGKLATGAVAPIAFQMPHEANRISLRQADAA